MWYILWFFLILGGLFLAFGVIYLVFSILGAILNFILGGIFDGDWDL